MAAKPLGGPRPPSSSPFVPLVPLLFFLCSSFLPSPVASQGAPAVDADRRVLLQMKKEWGNPPSLSSWIPSSSPCDGWNGVVCGSDGTVTAVSLVDQGIQGGVPDATCDLRNLSALSLYNNSVGGAFPVSLYNCTNLSSLNLGQNLFVGELPADIHRLSRLTSLDLSGNNFSGDVPTALGRITGLRQLRLDNNLFDGSFPRELGALAELENLTLAGNPFKPMALPVEFGNLRRLRYLWVRQANLVRQIPESFGNLTQLEHLDLAWNDLEGPIPGRIWQLPKLQRVYLFYNRLSGHIAGAGAFSASSLTDVDLSLNDLTGPIPEAFGKQPNLTYLFLYKNQLSGQIPDGIASMPALIDIRLFDNNLTGVLPPELGKNSKLLNLEVSDNRLYGKLPVGLCARGALNTLVVFNNRFMGGIPASLANCTTLQNLQVYGNEFYGEVPAGIWRLPQLGVMIMHGNALSGELPAALPPKLSRLEIENNRFSGGVPSSAPSLKVFRGSNNRFGGEIPGDLTGMAQLLELLLDRNQISGGIPASIGNLRLLAILNLSSNLLSGAIPAAMGSLPVLTTLDLSGNHLSGGIPREMGDLRLNFLNLSSNSLTGEIPPPLQNEAYDRSFLSNPGLCSGNALGHLLPCGRVASGRSDGLSKGLLTLFLVLGALVLLATLVLAFVVVRDLRRRKYGDDLASWKLTSFHSLDFTEGSIIRRLTADNLVGSGGSGQVYRVPLGNSAGEVVAVKKVWNSKKLNSKLEKEFEAEVKILGSIRHTNIVKLLCCISSPDSKLLVYEYMENGSLDQWLQGKRSGVSSLALDGVPATQQGFLDWPTRLSVAVGAARGLCYMHHDCSPPIAHRDVKSSNILLDAELKPKVADFGLARILVRSGEPETVSAVAGSFGYMAPECAYSRRVNEKVDVYSFGVVLLELATGRQANDGCDGLAEWAWRHFQEGNSVAEALDQRIRDPLYMEEMAVVLRLGLICTGTLPSTRPTMKDVLQVLLRCAQTFGEGDKPEPEYDATPLLRDVRKKSSRRIRASPDADDREDDESGLACNV